MMRRRAGALALGAWMAAAMAWGQAAPPRRLTLSEAKALAWKAHPRVLAARSDALAARQKVPIARSAYYPTLEEDLTGSQANVNARLGAGTLSASRLFDRFGQGLTLSQLVTDFGRTSNLVASARFQAEAANQTATATGYGAVLNAELAYVQALQAQAVVRVAEETVATRTTMLNQVTALAQNKLKSQMDVSFAAVNLSDARLMLIRARNNVQQAYAELAEAIGVDGPANFELIDEPLPSAPPEQAEPLIAEAIQNRPELAALRATSSAARRFAEAEGDLARPTVSGVAVAGELPAINASGIPGVYEAVGLNVSIPIFNGHLYSARHEAAVQQATAADHRVDALRLSVTRDVRAAWASVTTAHQRLGVSAQFVQQARLGLDLAQGRYNLGLSSIVEVTQAQLSLTRAEIEELAAKADYHAQHTVLQFTLGLLR
jgi:outer membrane protein